jgi:phosphotransferase system HPr (HPr) family protein
MVQRDIKLKSNVGLQAKNAAEFIQKASSFKSSIWVEKDEKKANAKSLLGLLALGITSNAELKLIADGEDEESAVTELGEFMLDNV